MDPKNIRNYSGDIDEVTDVGFWINARKESLELWLRSPSSPHGVGLSPYNKCRLVCDGFITLSSFHNKPGSREDFLERWVANVKRSQADREHERV